MDERVRCQRDGREVGRTQQGAAHLFEHDDELDVAVARAAVLLGDDEALEAHLLAHLTPHGVVVALLGVHQAAHLGFGRLLVEEGPHGAAKLFLLLAEGEVHGIPPGTARLGTSGPAFLLDPRVKPHMQAKDRATDAVMEVLPMHYSDDQIEIHKLVVGPYDNNVFVMRCVATGDAVLLDAANEHEKLLELCQRLNVRRVLETHGHWDHIQAVPQLRDAGYSVGVTAEDAAMLPSYDEVIEDDSVIQVGNVRLHTIHTPGHTPGSMCFLVEGSPVLFSGDTLFPGGPGATKFEGSSFPTIIESIDRRLLTLPVETLVLPGHGDDTTIGTERPHLQEWIDRGW